MNRNEKLRTAAVLAIFTTLFLALSVASFTRTSATYDESLHLTTGYMEWKYGDYRFDPEHPPFQRMWDALPLFFMSDVHPAPDIADKVDQFNWIGYGQFETAHQFLYKANDADRLLDAGRFMTALLGVLLGILLFCWTREWLGFWPAVAGLAMYSFEPNILAHSSLVTTDFSITCFLFGSAYFLWRLSRRLSVANVAGAAIFCALAVVSKFSAIVLIPIVPVLLAVCIFRQASWTCSVRSVGEMVSQRIRLAAAAIILLLVGLSCWAGIWAAYGFRYAPGANGGWSFDPAQNGAVRGNAPTLAAVVKRIDSTRLLPNAYVQGFLFGQQKSTGRVAYLTGKVSKNGWWYFFPVAFAIKTPTTLIFLFLGGLTLMGFRWRSIAKDAAFVLVPPAIFLVAAMNSNLNIGLRHILPIYPFVILLAAFCSTVMVRSRRQFFRIALILCFCFWLFEFASVYPHTLAFFNQTVGGPANGYKYLADSNLDWGQDLKPLKEWMDQNGVQRINLAYFGTADPLYYHMQCTYLPGSPFFDEALESAPQTPGYLAISVTNLDGVYLTSLERVFYAPLKNRQPVAVIGYSIFVYRLE